MIHKQGDIGVIGLAVMGQNLALNINNNGFNVIVFNRTLSTIKNLPTFINSVQSCYIYLLVYICKVFHITRSTFYVSIAIKLT